MQLSHRRVLDDVWVGATGAESHLRLADPDTCGCSPASCVSYGGEQCHHLDLGVDAPACTVLLGTFGLLPV